MSYSDPVEDLVESALKSRAIPYERDRLGLDFYLPDWGIYIEVKQFHSRRIAEQMSRTPNVIAIQGIGAARLFAFLISGRRPPVNE